MITGFNNRLKKLICKYQTRKQLLNLPEHLLKDIAITTEQSVTETKKNSLVNLLLQIIKRG